LIIINYLIQNGIYHIPSWLSQESISLLRLMLQVDPTERIRIDDLLRHQWLINHVYPESVKWESIYQVDLILLILQ
jgi:serine/threonine protein kinase